MSSAPADALARRRRALTLLEGALERPAAGRDAWLTQSCDGDGALRDEVLALLAADAVASASLPTEPPTPVTLAPAPPPPERIGPWRLAGLLGVGGMSRVYLGERDDGLFEQRVAIKLMSPGLFGAEMNRLFVVERRALARLQHRHIGRIYDGGVTDLGQPYLVMERIEGAPIDAFVRAAKLDVRATVRLFLQVAEATQSAHAALVAHGDIKPSNVIVSAAGESKLVDFGVAQLLEIEAEAAPGAVPVTPAYASPARMAGAAPTPADDIYSLGLLLRELLPPSAVRGDLGAIVAKARAADPAARYATAAALAEDLGRWLERRPVQARPVGWRIEFARFVERHPLAMLASTVAVIGLAVALVTTTALYLEAQAARAAAEQRFADARGMARYMLFDLYDRLERTPQSLAVRQDLAHQGQAYLDRLSRDPRAPAAVRLEAIDGLVRLADVEGAPERPNLGQAQLAQRNLAAAARLAAELVAAHPSWPQAQLAQARVQTQRARYAATVGGDTAAADRWIAAARSSLDAAQALPGGRALGALDEVRWRTALADVRGWEARYGEARSAAAQALAAIGELPAPVRAELPVRLLEARAVDLVAEETYYGGAPADAVGPYRQEVALMQAAQRDAPSDPIVRRGLVRALWALAATLVDVRRPADALPVLDQGLGEARLAIAFDAQDDDARRNLRLLTNVKGQALAGVGRWDDAIALLGGEVAERRAAWSADPSRVDHARDLAVSLASLADVQADARRTADACASYRQALAVFDHVRRGGGFTAYDQDHHITQLEARARPLCGL